MPIRLRLAIFFTLATLLLLGGGGWLYLNELGNGLNSSLDTTLRIRADALRLDVAAQDTADLEGTGPGSLLPVEDTVAQILRSDGTVVATSRGVARRSLLTAAQLKAARRGISFDSAIEAVLAPGKRPQDYRIRLLAAPGGRDGLIVVTGTSRDVVDDALHRATRQLLIFGAGVLLLGVTGSYLLARAALRPVEAMRAQAAELTAHDAGEGLRVPRTRDEVTRLAVTLNELLGRLHSALARERAFVADAGHELRTPLTVLKGELELAARPGRSNEQLSRTVAIAASETDRLIRLSEDLLMLAQADEGPFLRPAPTDVGELVEHAAEAHRSHAARSDVHLQTEAACVQFALVDADRIRQALDNLLANAIRFSPPGGTVILTVTSTGPDAAVTRICVSDEGQGFPPEFLPQAFERFRRADPARMRDASPAHRSGAGLGLAIVRAVAQAHGGSVSAENQPSGGARVCLDLPTGSAQPHGDRG